VNEILKCLNFSLNTKDKLRRFWTYKTWLYNILST